MSGGFPTPDEVARASGELGATIGRVRELGAELEREFVRLDRARRVLETAGATTLISFPDRPLAGAAWDAYTTPALPPVARLAQKARS